MVAASVAIVPIKLSCESCRELAREKKRKKGQGEERRGNASSQTPRFWTILLDIILVKLIKTHCSKINTELMRWKIFKIYFKILPIYLDICEY